MRGNRQWRWHLDEVFVKFNGEQHRGLNVHAPCPT
jgi:transposase-like protein